MYYIIQENVFREPNYDNIFIVLEKLNLPFEIVKIEPFAENFEVKTELENVFVYGSVKLAKIAQQYNFKPGSYYGGNHSFEVYSKYYGNNLLNYDSEIAEFGHNLKWEVGEEKFIRPSRDAKVFTGKKFTEIKWNDFVEQALNSKENTLLNRDTKIQITKPKKIYKEARVWIVGGKVATSSYYLFHGNIEFEENVDIEGINFAEKMTKIYEVADAFVMDICLTSEGWKIVEINCVNSAGFYKADIEKLIIALEEKLNVKKITTNA
ncbi:ATP-grasp domain-containing protein [Flavobacterium aestivum]|uniref:ATP-grasp domain-containing protein n=1 Tax=Flavobacterium aestivum TaxID=3003257 RepID=UPI002285DB8A|nr:ATP-grasp domain-containing protein [Flavobacterium aestivum]